MGFDTVDDPLESEAATVYVVIDLIGDVVADIPVGVRAVDNEQGPTQAEDETEYRRGGQGVPLPPIDAPHCVLIGRKEFIQGGRRAEKRKNGGRVRSGGGMEEAKIDSFSSGGMRERDRKT